MPNLIGGGYEHEAVCRRASTIFISKHPPSTVGWGGEGPFAGVGDEHADLDLFPSVRGWVYLYLVSRGRASKKITGPRFSECCAHSGHSGWAGPKAPLDVREPPRRSAPIHPHPLLLPLHLFSPSTLTPLTRHPLAPAPPVPLTPTPRLPAPLYPRPPSPNPHTLLL